jgi:hypothetical protein
VAGFLVTIGGCRHLDGMEQWWSFGTSWILFVATPGDFCEGFLTFSPAESQKVL